MATDITPAPRALGSRAMSGLDDKHEIENVEDTADMKLEQADDVIMKSPFEDLPFSKTWVVFRKAALMSLFAAFSAAADGYQIAMTGTIIANKGFILQFGTAKNAAGAVILDASVLAAWGGIQSAGQGLGMLTQHFIADRFGRKKAFYTLWVSLLIAVCLESFGKTWQTWLLAKLTSGFGVGSVQFMTGMYCTEIAPSRIRGFILLFYSVWYGLGQMFASVCIKISNDRDPYNYLTPVYTEWAVLAVLLAVYLYIPESPFWCATRGRHEQGEKIIGRLNGGIEGYDIGFHYGTIRRTIEVERAHSRMIDGEERGFLQELRNLKEVFIGSNGMRTFIAFWPAFTQQMTGLAVLSNYSSYFASVAGFTDAFTFSLLLSLVALGATVIEAVLIDFVGRRMLFLGGIVATWMMLMIVGGLGLIPDKSYSLNQLVLFFALVWRMASTLLGSLGWSFCAEAGTSRLRAKTSGVAAAGGVCTGLIFSTSVPYMLNANYANWGLKTCFFFAGLGFPLVVASFFVIPDTSRRTPAELDEMFKKGVKPWRFRSYVTDAQKALEAERLRTGETDPAKLQNKDRI